MANLPAHVHASVVTGAPGSLRFDGLRTPDIQRIAPAIDTEVAKSTGTTYASGWRSWEIWRRRGLVPLPADWDALAA